LSSKNEEEGQRQLSPQTVCKFRRFVIEESKWLQAVFTVRQISVLGIFSPDVVGFDLRLEFLVRTGDEGILFEWIVFDSFSCID
jgi:hypothetical protein